MTLVPASSWEIIILHTYLLISELLRSTDVIVTAVPLVPSQAPKYGASVEFKLEEMKYFMTLITAKHLWSSFQLLGVETAESSQPGPPEEWPSPEGSFFAPDCTWKQLYPSPFSWIQNYSGTFHGWTEISFLVYWSSTSPCAHEHPSHTFPSNDS